MTEEATLVTVWNSYDQDGAFYGIYGQAYDFQGGDAPIANGPETRINITTAEFQQEPALAAGTGSTVIIAWQDGARREAGGTDDDDYGVAQAIYSAERQLPVELLSFTGRVVGKVNELNWLAANADGFSHFVVERAAGGQGWEVLGEVAGAELGREEQGYAYQDEQPSPLSYYRLRMVDTDGSVEFSPVVVLQRTTESNQLLAYPNPNNGTFRVDFPAVYGGVLLTLYTTHGTRVLAQKLPAGTRSWQQQNQLKPGAYQLVVTNGKQRWSEKIIAE